MICLKRGSIFDEKCDLIIIPCNNYGGVSNMISEDLMINDLPYYCVKMNVGDVKFFDNIGAFTNATYLGFAASVNVDIYDNMDSKTALKRICLLIKEYSLNNYIRKVNLPLLGTGAGKLNPIDCFNIIFEEFSKITNIEVNVFALTNEIYDTIRKDSKYKQSDDRIKPPRTFISYTGVNKNNRKWVKEFATKLRENGVDARVDMFHLKAGQDLPQWMANEIVLADKVILICDKEYAKKANTKKGGAGWETMIIQGDMLHNLNQNKYFCIVREEKIDEGLPLYMNSRFSYMWNNEEKYSEEFKNLLFNLFDCDDTPPIGNPPDYIKVAYSNKKTAAN